MSEPKIGVALTKCFYCGKDDRILLDQRLRAGRSPVEKAHGKVIDMEPCQECAELMKQGIILITIDDAKSDPRWNIPPPVDEWSYNTGRKTRDGWIPNPYRTGGFFVIREEAARRIFNDTDAALTHALKHRWIFIEHEAAEKIGLFAQARKE